MRSFRTLAATVVFSLGSAPAQAGVLDYAKSCWLALVGNEAVVAPTAAPAPTPATPPPATDTAPSQGPQPGAEGVVGYRDLARPQRDGRLSTAGVRFVRDYTYPVLGEAWRAIDETVGGRDMIWGDVVRNADGSIRYMTYDEAMDYCIGLNLEADRAAIRTALKSGQAPEQGIYLPLHSDFQRLRRQLGSTAKGWEFTAPGYKAQILPHRSYWFRSSSVYADASNYAYVFNGYSGEFDYAQRSSSYDRVAVRCVR